MTDARDVIVRWLIDDMSMDDNEFIPEIAGELIAALSAAGFAIVPKEPTRRMTQHALTVLDSCELETVEVAYRAMVEAAKDE